VRERRCEGERERGREIAKMRKCESVKSGNGKRDLANGRRPPQWSEKNTNYSVSSVNPVVK